MRRGVVHIGGWALATGAMIGLSWYGVHSVLAGTAVAAPRALPAAGALPTDDSQPLPALPTASATPSTTPSATASPSAPAPATRTASPVTSPTGWPGGPRPSSGTGTRTYTVHGGHAVLDLGASSATLVSATPDAGWSMKYWEQPGWIRVDFTSDGHTSAVFCSWNGHPPTVETVNS